MALKWNLIFEGVSTLVLLGGGIYAFGRFTDKQEQLERRVTALEGKTMPGTHLGELCLKLLDDESAAIQKDDNVMSGKVEEQLRQFHCYDRVNANATTMAKEAQPQNAVTNSDELRR